MNLEKSEFLELGTKQDLASLIEKDFLSEIIYD